MTAGGADVYLVCQTLTLYLLAKSIGRLLATAGQAAGARTDCDTWLVWIQGRETSRPKTFQVLRTV
jgi:hypothetical protein